MSVQLDKPELFDSCGFAIAGPCGFLDPEIEGGAHRLAPARGIICAIFIAIPLWVLLAFMAYLLI